MQNVYKSEKQKNEIKTTTSIVFGDGIHQQGNTDK